MGPKKGKKGGKDEKKKKKGPDQDLLEQMQKTVEEIDSLQNQLAFRSELLRKCDNHRQTTDDKIKQLEKVITEKEAETKAVGSELVRQYKAMNTEMGYKIFKLDQNLQITQQKLSETEKELIATTRRMEEMRQEKDSKIFELQNELGQLEAKYTNIILTSLDSLGKKVSEQERTGVDQATRVLSRHKEKLYEMGLRPNDIC